MDNSQYQKEINEAISAADTALICLENTSKYLSSAGGWGIFDILGGGLITSLVKHNKLDNAKVEMERAKQAIKALKKEMLDIDQIAEINLDMGEFLTLADFFFDGFVADWLVQSKIREAERQVNQAIVQIRDLRIQLFNLKNL
ncbi:MAG: hypothetical protein K5917_05895 [Clostridiales bacterium]|nr:hypothetical protein [Clostridiales bacterium]